MRCRRPDTTERTGRGGARLVCDAGPIGPDYQPGHAHGDLLLVRAFARRAARADRLRRTRLRGRRAARLVPLDARAQHRRDRRPEPVRVLVGVPRRAPRASPRRAFRAARGRLPPLGLARRLPASGGRAAPPAPVRLAPARRPAREGRGRRRAARDGALAPAPAPGLCRRGDRGPLRPGSGTRAASSRSGFAGAGELALEASDYCPEFGSRIPRRALRFETTGASLVFGFCVANGAEQIEYDLDSGASVSGEKVPW